MTASPGLLEAARAILVAIGVEVGVARLSKDGTAWVCPRCGRKGDCKPGCTLAALLSAADNLDACIAAEQAPGEARHCKCCSGYDWDGSDCPGTPAEREPHYHGGEACHGEDCVGDAQKEEAP